MLHNNIDIAFTMTAHKRDVYLENVLDSLQQSADYLKISLSDVKLYISIDYYDDIIPNIIKDIDWIDTEYIINNPSVGCNRNTLQALLLGLDKHQAIIHLEDDTVLCKDSISFYVNAIEKYFEDENIISISGYNKTIEKHKQKLDANIKQKHFTCWGCAFWKHKFDVIRDNWIPYMDRNNNSYSWDTHINHHLFSDDKYNFYQIKPEISRIQNIGAEGGTWVPSVEFHELNHRTPITSEDFLL